MTPAGKGRDPAATVTNMISEDRPSSARSRSATDDSSDDGWAGPTNKKSPFDTKHFLAKGESLESFEVLMMVTFRTLLQLNDKGLDTSGLIKHGMILSEKASKGIYKSTALIDYDRSVRERASHYGVRAFSTVSNEDAIRYFSYDNTEHRTMPTKTARASYTKRKPEHRVCLRYNGDAGCYAKSCIYTHRCLLCEELGHPRADCRNYRRKDNK